MRIKEARQRCPDFIQVPARPERYAAVSTRIMAALEDVTPLVEVFSVDEAFLDLTDCQRLWGNAEHMGHLIKKTVHKVSGLPCSVGVSGDKTTAKYAAKLNKPDGLSIIPPWEARERLAPVAVTELCGIGTGIGRFLAERNVYTCGDMEKLPIGELARRFGNPGRRMWYMCQGRDPEKLITRVPPPKSIGHGKVVPPNTRDKAVIHTWFLHMSEKVAGRLRRHGMEASEFSIGLRTAQAWAGATLKTACPTQDGHHIMILCEEMLDSCWNGEGIFQVQVTALRPQLKGQQLALFEQDTQKMDAFNQVMDRINERYGEFVLAPARLLNRSDMPNVIAPAWKPFGHRKTV
jgi:DNA polymerase-4